MKCSTCGAVINELEVISSSVLGYVMGEILEVGIGTGASFMVEDVDSEYYQLLEDDSTGQCVECVKSEIRGVLQTQFVRKS